MQAKLRLCLYTLLINLVQLVLFFESYYWEYFTKFVTDVDNGCLVFKAFEMAPTILSAVEYCMPGSPVYTFLGKIRTF